MIKTSKYFKLVGLYCITLHNTVQSLISQEVLKVQALVDWDTAGANPELSNKLVLGSKCNEIIETISNFRFLSYRNIYFWIFGKKTARRGFRQALPQCLVSVVRSKYPDQQDRYTGFIQTQGNAKKRRA